MVVVVSSSMDLNLACLENYYKIIPTVQFNVTTLAFSFAIYAGYLIMPAIYHWGACMWLLDLLEIVKNILKLHLARFKRDTVDNMFELHLQASCVRISDVPGLYAINVLPNNKNTN